MPIGRLRARLLDAPLRWLAAGVGAVVVGVSGFFGGLKPAQEPPLPTPSVNAAFTGKPWNITVNSVVLLGDTPPALLEHKGDRWLVVVATIEITGNESMTLYTEALRVSGVKGVGLVRANEIRYASTGSIAASLHPGVPEKLDFFWEQGADAPVPDTAEVAIYGATYHEPAQGENVYSWIPDGGAPIAHLKVPVQDRRSQK